MKMLDDMRAQVQIKRMKLDAISLSESRSTPATLLIKYVSAALAVVVATIAGQLIARYWGSAAVVLLYIPPVIAVAIYGGLWPALAAAVAATLAYNYYFTAPYHTFMINSGADVVTVIILFLVALVTSQLIGMLREQAALASAHAQRNASIAGFARRLLSCANKKDISEVTVSELSKLFDCNAVLVTGDETPQLAASAPHAVLLAPSDLAAAAMAIGTGEPAGRGVQRVHLADWQFHPIISNDRVLGAIGVARNDGTAPVAPDQIALLDNLLDQVALAFERAQLESDARDFATLRERDKLRSSLLMAIGEEVKPRLNAIGSAARALKRDGSGDKALAASVAAEVVKLDRYVDNLVDFNPGTDQEPIIVGTLSIDLHSRAVIKAGEKVHLTPKEFEVLAELAKHAGRVLPHAHLLRAVWGPAQSDQIDYLRVAIRALRQKLEDNPAQPRLILNEPAVGYRLTAA
jgi:two-component system, OmpR family, sensor histidine kinase KdpD